MSNLVELEIYPVVGRKVWHLFAPHHYLTSSFSGHRTWLAVLSDGTPVALTSDMPFPHGSIKNGRRGHRTVVLPDYQGLGIGARLSDWLGEFVLREGRRFFSRTSNPRLGLYRETSPLWRPTSTNRKKRSENVQGAQDPDGRGNWVVDTRRTAFSHEYVGALAPTETL